MPDERPSPPLRVFISYSHKNDYELERLRTHLAQLARDGLIEPWSDNHLIASEEWACVINKQLDSANIVILLLSPDFLASDYCQEVEIPRALGRSEVRVVSVILSECDWENTPLARLQVLPRRGKPIKNWPKEGGYADVAKGLRKLINTIITPPPASLHRSFPLVTRHRWRWIAVPLLAAIALVWWNARNSLNQGKKLLNIARYSDARPYLENARWFSSTARCGLQAADLDVLRQRDPENFRQQLPNESDCAYVRMLSGDQKYLTGDLKRAISDYEAALKQEPDLAEAHFNIGIILSRLERPDDARPHYEQAVRLSPGTGRYHLNLADSYFRREEYDLALEQYGRLERSPLAALESARIYRRQGKLDYARSREEQAVKWLEDPAVQKIDNENAWKFDTSPTEQARVGPIEEKRCFADVELAITRFLQGEDTVGFDKCGSMKPDLKAILLWELRSLSNQTPAVADRADALARKLQTTP